MLDDSRKWWKVQNMSGRVGHVPNTIVTLYNFPSDGGPVGPSGSGSPPGAVDDIRHQHQHQVAASAADRDQQRHQGDAFANPLYSPADGDDVYYPSGHRQHGQAASVGGVRGGGRQQQRGTGRVYGGQWGGGGDYLMD